MSSVNNKVAKHINFSKGFLLVFFIVFLIGYGFAITEFISLYQKNNPGSFLPSYINYLPLACYVGSGFIGILFLIYVRNIFIQKSREIKAKRKIKKGSIYKQALFIVIFLFSFIPLIGPIFDHGQNDQNFSIYNNGWNGASTFKTALENDGYEVMALQSSLSATERLDKSVLLILLGPNQFYNPIFEIPFFINFFDNESHNSLLICHDHGSTSMLLWEIFIAGALDPDIGGRFPVTIFPDGILRDNGSYEMRPDFPVIKSFAAHEITTGISQVILSEASAAVGGPFITQFGWELIGSTTEYGYVDKDNDHVYEFEDDNIDLGSMLSYFPNFPNKWPLGGYSQSVFMAKDLGTSRVFVSSDASLFNNELINDPRFDNLQFGLNIIHWLTFGEPKENWIIVFDEAHIRPEYSRDLTSAGIYGFIIQYIIHLSTNPVTAWIYPLLAIYSLRKYLPKKDEKAEKKKIKEQEKREERARFRTSSFFAEKIQWYREKSKYDKALLLLYRRLERKLNNLLRGKKITSKNVVDLVISKEPNVNKLKVKRIARFIDRMVALKSGNLKIKDEQDFEEIYFEMEWVVNNI